MNSRGTHFLQMAKQTTSPWIGVPTASRRGSDEYALANQPTVKAEVRWPNPSASDHALSVASISRSASTNRSG